MLRLNKLEYKIMQVYINSSHSKNDGHNRYANTDYDLTKNHLIKEAINDYKR